MDNQAAAREAHQQRVSGYTARAQEIIDTGQHAAQLAETAAGLAQEAAEQARLATQVSDEERPNLIQTAQQSLADAREADDAARDPNFGTEASVREEVRNIGTMAREDGNSALAENLEEQSDDFINRRTEALTESDRLIREAEESLYEAQQM
jgi:hypothetical protein